MTVENKRKFPRNFFGNFFGNWRSLGAQLIVVFGAVGFIWWLGDNVTENLAQQNIASGFDFLEEPAGFAITQSPIDYSEKDSYGRVLLVGLSNTLLCSIAGIFFATILGIFIGIARLSRNWIVRRFAEAYVETLRNIPLLLQILFWYFAVLLAAVPGPRESLGLMPGVFLNNRGLYVPSFDFHGYGLWLAASLVVGAMIALALRWWVRRRQRLTGKVFPVFWAMLLGGLLPLGLTFLALGMPLSVNVPSLRGFNYVGGTRVFPEFVALCWALSLYTASFIGEIVRSGIMSVDQGQREASQALGLSQTETLRLVIFPQAIRLIIPQLTSQYLNLMKNSSLAVAIAYPDLVSVFAGTALNQTGQAIEILSITMGVYLSLSLLTSLFMNYYNRWIASRGYE